MRGRISGRLVLWGLALLAAATLISYALIAQALKDVHGEVTQELEAAPGPAGETAPDDGGGAALPPLPRFPFESMEPAVRRQFVAAAGRAEADPRDAGAAGRLGMLFAAYEHYASAEPCLRRAAALAPREPRWRYHLGVALLEQGRFDEAAGAFSRTVALADGDALAARLSLAEARRRAGRLEAARAAYEDVLALAPGTAQAHCGLGQVALRSGDPEAAAGHLERAVALAPAYGTAHYALGQALRKLGRMEDARARLALAEEHRGREPALDDPLAGEPAALRTGAVDALHRGIDLAQAGRYEEAIELFEEALAADPELAEAHAQMGAARLALGEATVARRHLERALALEPGLADAHYNMGLAAHRAGHPGAAVAHFRRAVAARPDHFDARLGLGTDLPDLDRAPEAIEHLRAALRLRPQDPRPYRRLAALLAAGGRHEEAVEALRLGVRRLPEDPALADRLAWHLATCPDGRLRAPAEALRLAEAVCRRTGNRVPRALDTLAAALAASGRFDEAAATAERAAELARRSGREELAGAIEGRLAGYRNGRPYVSGSHSLSG